MVTAYKGQLGTGQEVVPFWRSKIYCQDNYEVLCLGPLNLLRFLQLCPLYEVALYLEGVPL